LILELMLYLGRKKRTRLTGVLADLLIIGTGPRVTPIAPAMRKYLNNLGIRLEIQDTRNASAQFNLLATERGVQQVAAALIPIGFREERRI
jgi:NADH dehydrogenase [ubiquinone] 1 alpha subcomplex assembly factor 3